MGVLALSLGSDVSLVVLSESLSSPISLWSESSSSTTLMMRSNASLSDVLRSKNIQKIRVNYMPMTYLGLITKHVEYLYTISLMSEYTLEIE